MKIPNANVAKNGSILFNNPLFPIDFTSQKLLILIYVGFSILVSNHILSRLTKAAKSFHAGKRKIPNFFIFCGSDMLLCLSFCFTIMFQV